ncbi:Hypothetical protein CINCED_3A023857 [Cinara cedri]|uniref:Thioredoxin domain-containing protein n=1 Tax=Cinara cedri TaxID=506608 RepID=A0A5E4N1M4_9HEMI|nr:Hypothetical protein CINCED_3A023857 [Cinara cedri]
MSKLLCAIITVIISVCLLALISCTNADGHGSLELDEDNWSDILTGEWMVLFYAPWCPACKSLEPEWREFGKLSEQHLDISVASTDITLSPGLTGRFIVTTLPTIFHVKDGIFRYYKMGRDKESMISFVKERKWEKLESISSWKAPNSIQMSILAQFFKMSQKVRILHSALVAEYGLPTWGSYLIFAIATIFVGAVLGLILVCIIDFIYPPNHPKDHSKDKDKECSDSGQESDDELVKDEIIDDRDCDEPTKTDQTLKNRRKNRRTD